jgi:hypothetical protein
MSGDPNHIEEAVRETLASLSDRQLITRTQSAEYTEFARQAAREEMAKRSRARAARSHSALSGSNAETEDREDSSRDATGCYIDLWQSKSYDGEHVRVDGPGEYQNLRSQPTPWGNEVCSLRVGPCAFVEAYEDKGLTGSKVCFGPNQEVPDLAELELDNRLGSMKILSSIKIFDGLGSADKQDIDVHRSPVQQILKRQKARKTGHNRKPQS